MKDVGHDIAIWKGIMAFLHRLANLFYVSASLDQARSEGTALHFSPCALIVRRRTRRDEEERTAF